MIEICCFRRYSIENPNLYAEVADSSGINTVGTGIGHNVSAIIDENNYQTNYFKWRLLRSWSEQFSDG